MLKDKLKNYRLILASGSPRRQQFLRELDVDFEIRLKDVAEIYPPNLQGAEITDFLAKLKADALEDSLTDNEIAITSDTIVWHENKALGKPTDYDDAFAMLQKLSGKTHEVITSVCIKNAGKADVFNETTRVTFNTLSDEEIKYYLDNYKPFDKAGSYGIQEWIGLVAIARIDGSYANVVGMPVDKVYQYLSKFA
ncbi:Maf-like protein [Flavobacterium subsaxonicum]|uniref:dTTP/UTP pyrophosphatase n=1 Tax=Flavobacterium subsaxonicum WB 4.1-42 = DSM 21790 TaxID=1121898 RepID=A0A0A2MRD3_9FLAO|nr:Maf-like protein [Flavobacterium subsaxonicum]KGO95202.1 septum formation inhibitor Maf [Flavobacterium subsaxonicum WB 4.1-42 = DSM 21790]